MTRLVLFKGGVDPWHRPDQTGLSKTGYVTAAGIVIIRAEAGSHARH